MLLMHSFFTLHIHILGRHKNGCHESFMLLRAIKVVQNESFEALFQFSSDKMILCYNNDQTWFSDTLISARSLRVVKGLGFNTTLGVQQMLMHRKTCLNPIYNKYSYLVDWPIYSSYANVYFPCINLLQKWLELA